MNLNTQNMFIDKVFRIISKSRTRIVSQLQELNPVDFINKKKKPNPIFQRKGYYDLINEFYSLKIIYSWLKIIPVKYYTLPITYPLNKNYPLLYFKFTKKT